MSPGGYAENVFDVYIPPDEDDPFCNEWRVPRLFAVLNTCQEWGMTLFDFLDQPVDHQALMIAFIDAKGRMRAVEEKESRMARKHRDHVSRMTGGR